MVKWYSSAGLLALLLSLPSISVAQCVQSGSTYEGFRVTSVTVDSPLEFPVQFIQKPLLGSAIASLQSIADTLPVKKGGIFHFADHVAAMAQLSQSYTETVNFRERIKLALVVPKFPACDQTARTVDIAYRVYSTHAAYFVSRLLESTPILPDRSLTIGKAAETQGKILAVPFAGYNRSRRGFGGIKASWSGSGGPFNSATIEAGGSSSSYSAGVSLGNSRDPGRGLFSHIEWKIGFHSSNDPAGTLDLAKSVGTAQILTATRAYGPLATIFRFGAAIEAGKLSTGTNISGMLSDAPQRVLKAYAGGTWSYARQIWNASYGFQLGKGTDSGPVDYTKHLVDVTHQARFLMSEHWPIQLDSHFNAGWILGSPFLVPVAERFFGGNLPGDFVNSALWNFPSGPLLRSFPQNRLNTSSSGQPIGGTKFTALNITAAFPMRVYPAMPAMVRNAKQVGDGIHLGLQQAQSTSLEDFRAHTRLFPDILKRAVNIGPHLEALRTRLSALSDDGLSDDLNEELEDLITNSIDSALNDLRTAQKVPHNGLAWSVCHKLAGDDPDSYPLAHLHDDILNTVAPELESAGRAKDALDLRAMANQLDRDKQDLAALLAAIEPFSVVPQSKLDTFAGDLKKINDLGKRLKEESQAFKTSDASVSTLAFEAGEWGQALVAATEDPGPNPNAFDSLYTLIRLTLGIGKLVPPQIQSAISAIDQLAEAIKTDHPAESDRLTQIANDLRASLANITPRVRQLKIPAGERWAKQQNEYFVRALDVAFREMNLAAVSPVVVFDAARIGPQQANTPAWRYGVGPGIRFSIVSFQVTAAYSFNPNPRMLEPRGAFFFSMNVVDLFR